MEVDCRQSIAEEKLKMNPPSFGDGGGRGGDGIYWVLHLLNAKQGEMFPQHEVSSGGEGLGTDPTLPGTYMARFWHPYSPSFRARPWALMQQQFTEWGNVTEHSRCHGNPRSVDLSPNQAHPLSG